MSSMSSAEQYSFRESGKPQIQKHSINMQSICDPPKFKKKKRSEEYDHPKFVQLRKVTQNLNKSGFKLKKCILSSVNFGLIFFSRT